MFVIILLGLVYCVLALIPLAVYAFQAYSWYTIAARRGIRNAWLAWVPVGNMWILGGISDQYQHLVNGKKKNKRKGMLALAFVSALLVVVYVIVLVMLLVLGLRGGGIGEIGVSEVVALMGGAAGVVLLTLGMGCTVIAMAVLQYMALYDLYRSCDPDKALLYLLLSIFFNITMPICLFCCRNQDEGMPK